jgi:hypothetical protein
MSGTTSIPASQIVNVSPSVLSAGGSALDLNGLFLTANTRVPLGTVQAFPTQAAVAAYFGATAAEAALASNYFLGFDNSNVKPGSLLFAQYNQTSVSAYLRGSNVSAGGVAGIQAIPSGIIAVTIDGTLKTSSSITLTSASSFSAAAQLISTALSATGPQRSAFTAAIAGTTMTVSAMTSGTISVGDQIVGAGVTVNTYVSAILTGTGGIGTYTVTPTQTIASESMTSALPVVTYDSVSGAFVVTSGTVGAASTVSFVSGTIAAALGLTAAVGAVQSIGAVAATPAGALNAIKAITQDWASFMTAFDPDGGSGNTIKMAFAAWANTQNKRFVYACWDNDINATLTGQTTTMGYLLDQANSDGTALVYAPVNGAQTAAFLCGAIASVDFTETQGRVTFAFKGQSGLAPDVTSQVIASNLEANGYSYVGNFSTANDSFTFLYPGSVTGAFAWLDSYINQIWLTNQFQVALMSLLTQVKSIPYNPSGYAMIRAALIDPINQAANFGALQPGVTLSNLQAVEVNTAAGLTIAPTITSVGWYLQVKDAAPQVRASRGSPPCTFWYADGGSVQRINLASVEVQ